MPLTDPKCRVAYNDEGLLEEAVTDGDAHLKRISGKGWFLSMGRSDGSELCLRFECNAMITEDRLANNPPPITPGSLRVVNDARAEITLRFWQTAMIGVALIFAGSGFGALALAALAS